MPSEVRDYEVLCTIGAGSCGTCKKIRRLRDGKVLVWKELDYSSASDSEKQMLVFEVNLLRELKHEHIVRYVDRIIDRKHSMLYLVMEFCEGGDLASYIARIKKDGLQIEESFVWRVCYQLTQAINECHSRSTKDGKSVMHRDLKPANIFLDSNLNVKLGDFGLARVLSHETSFSKTYVGTPLYMSPEQMSGTAYNEKSDIWSLGCLLYELCALHPPFIAGSQLELAAKICSGRFMRIPPSYSNELQCFISTLMQLNLDKRPSVSCLLSNATLLKHVNKTTPEAPSSSGFDEVAYGRCLELIRKREEEVLAREEEVLAREAALDKRKLELDVRHQELDRRSQDLEKHSREIEAQAMDLMVRERLAEDRLSRVERLMEVYAEAKAKSKVTEPNRTAPGTDIRNYDFAPLSHRQSAIWETDYETSFDGSFVDDRLSLSRSESDFEIDELS